VKMPVKVFFLRFYLYILERGGRERASAGQRVEGEGEEEGKNPKQTPHWAWSPDAGLCPGTLKS